MTSHLPQPPPQLSEGTFRTFEPFIHEAIRNWPEETKWTLDVMINPKTQRQLSPVTFAARMRDSVVSYQRNAWESYIDRTKFETIYGQFAVSYDPDGSVWFRNRARRGRPLTFTGDVGKAVAISPHAQQIWTGWTDEQVNAAIVLLHHGRLTGPIIFPGRILGDYSQWETLHNVAVFYDEKNNQTVIT